MNTREDFLLRLAEDEDDDAARLVYSDWLEEQGEYEEAERQRSWTAAKAWLVEFAARNSHPYGDLEDDYYSLTYEDLMGIGRQAAAARGTGSPRDEDDGFSIHVGHREWVGDSIRESGDRFWKNWSIVTGVLLPPNFGDRISYRCAC